MGLGSHKLLDYLSLGLTMPLEYHPHNLQATCFTKVAKDLMDIRKEIALVVNPS